MAFVQSETNPATSSNLDEPSAKLKRGEGLTKDCVARMLIVIDATTATIGASDYAGL